MSKIEIISEVAKKSGLTKIESRRAVDALVAVLIDTLARGESAQLVGFGSFGVRKREARKGRNPATGAEIQISAKTVPVFKAGKVLKESVAK